MGTFFKFYGKTNLLVVVSGPFRVEDLVNIEDTPSARFAC